MRTTPATTSTTLRTTIATTDRRHGVTARARILGWMMLLVTLAICILVLIAARILLARADASIKTELGHEGEKFRVFAAEPDPATGRPFTEVQQLLSAFLVRNVAEEDETFFSVLDGRADRRSPHDPPARLDTDPQFVARVAAATEPISGKVDTVAGPAYYAVYPARVQGDPQTGALVVVEFGQPLRDEALSTVRILAIVGAGALLVAGLVGWLVAGRVLAPIRLVRRTAERIGESDLGRRIDVVGNDDVAQLARTFNRMLDRLEAAFAGQRRFLDDAGHELRTPITVVRGHLELMGDDPAERRQTVELVIAELDRMNRIVDDLFMLARSERPDFLILGPVDLADLVVETLTKASALGDRRFGIDHIAPETVTADGQRLTQALMQLVSNAVQHTASGDTIALGSAVEGDRARVWVRDTGVGIAPDDQERVFDRFARGAGHRGRPGAGLGLSIVATIAVAHGGRVTLVSAPGHGSTFTLDFPRRPVDSERSAAPALTTTQEPPR